MNNSNEMNKNNRMNENLKYNAWLKAVKTNQPILNDPDELLQNIMSDIQLAPLKKSSKKIEKIWKMVTSASAVAATFLLCLFVYEVELQSSFEKNTTVSINQFDDSALQQVFSTFSDECSNQEPSYKRKNCILKRLQEKREEQVQKKMQLFGKRYSNTSNTSF